MIGRLYTLDQNDPAYNKYYHLISEDDKQDIGPAILPHTQRWRVAKYFNGRLFFGDARLDPSNNVYKYHIAYDDGDRENFNETEYRDGLLLAEENRKHPAYQNLGGNVWYDVCSVKQNVKVERVLDVTCVTAEGVKYAVVRCEISYGNKTMMQMSLALNVLPYEGSMTGAPMHAVVEGTESRPSTDQGLPGPAEPVKKKKRLGKQRRAAKRMSNSSVAGGEELLFALEV